ncbi:hypothetical protein [Amycolatopsis jejuensis]|uniref:hypothetical protein n=1 Tax=Amycolatopsis jejuensis TaxID=330084 RepID=UPI000527A568|nr:hypothetical protein [Amycolatopsis jejuensis]
MPDQTENASEGTTRLVTFTAIELDRDGKLVDQESFVIDLDSAESNEEGTVSAWLGTVDGQRVRVTIEELPR